MQCDICNEPGQGTVVKAADMSNAVRKGFNPFRCGLIPEALAQLAGPGYADRWAQQATDGISSHSDWNICAKCMTKLKPYLSGAGQSQCFVATAAMGSPDAWQVVSLRNYRDEVLKAHKLGVAFISLYHAVSPPIARFISGKNWLRGVVRSAFVTPLARLAKWRMDRAQHRGV